MTSHLLIFLNRVSKVFETLYPSVLLELAVNQCLLDGPATFRLVLEPHLFMINCSVLAHDLLEAV